MRDPAYLATAIACVAALAAINTAYAIRRRRRQHQARKQAQLELLQHTLQRQVWAAEFEHVRLVVEGQFAALGSDALWARFLNLHPELRAGSTT